MAAYEGGGSDGSWVRFSGKEAEAQPGPVETVKRAVGERLG